MIDKNLVDLTNEDILSSLKVIATTCNCNECKIRNCKWGTCNCSQITANAALDLINRQKAEIERLKSANDENFRQWDMLTEKTKQHYADLYNDAKDTLKAEAYKEYHIKAKSCLKANRDVEQQIGNNYVVKRIKEIENRLDNILKEMVGE